MDINEEIILKKYMPNNSEMKTLSSFFYAFSDDTRLKIIVLLIIKPLCVGDISEMLKINQTTVSHQLKILKSYNIVDSERNGKNVVYHIKNSNIESVLNATVDCI